MQTRKRRGIKLKSNDPEHKPTNLRDGGLDPFQTEVVTRLRRVETRLVAGMESLGANLTNNLDGIKVEGKPEGEWDVGLITITSLGTTVKDLLSVLHGETGTYDISYNGAIKCQISVGFDPMKVVL